jgi:hypothetical protein
MPKTIGGVITDARVILSDVAGDRYTDDELISDFNNAISQTKTLRPDAFILGEALPEYTSADLAEDFPLSEIFVQSFVYFLAGNAELRDDEFAVDNRAMTLLAAFRRDLTGRP